MWASEASEGSAALVRPAEGREAEAQAQAVVGGGGATVPGILECPNVVIPPSTWSGWRTCRSMQGLGRGTPRRGDERMGCWAENQRTRDHGAEGRPEAQAGLRALGFARSGT